MQTEAGHSPVEGFTWEGKSVALSDIERELNRMWRDAAGSAERYAPVRASVLNLVVHTTSDAVAQELSETISRLAGRHPLRAIIISAEPHHPQPSLDTQISAYCSEDPGAGAQVCCEQVIVSANGEPANHLTGIITPLLIPDLPVYLWWMGEPHYESETFSNLMRSAQKLIIDSGSFSPSPASFRQALELSRKTRDVCAVNDLNWMRLWPWFEVVAQFFDEPNLRPHLYGIQRVAAEYAQGSPAQAVMLAGWLFSRLGESPTQVELKPAPGPGAGSGNIQSFRMDTQAAGETASFSVSLAQTGAGHMQARVRVGGKDLLDRVVVATDRSDVEMLDIALESCHRDLPYEESLEIAAKLIEGEAVQ